MSFLQPWILFGLPLITLPIIIHLINQRRYQSIQWAAMMFLLAAHRMSRGYSRLRQWLIMAARMLAVAGLVFAASRPLASGWFGSVAGGKTDTTIILIDRSPSMQQRGNGTGDSKLQTGRNQLVQALEALGSERWVLIESAARTPRELQSPRALLDLPEAGPASAPAELPAMLQAAHDYIRDNHTGRTEVWMLSDLHQNDWAPESGRWRALHDAFLEFPQEVRFHLLAYPQTAPANISVRVTDARRRATSDGVELLVSLRLTRESDAEEKVRVPVQFEIEGARSVVNLDVTGTHVDLKDHAIPLDATKQRGWGRVSIPADANPADNDYYFVFDEPPPRHTVIVADDPLVERPLKIAAEIPPDPAFKCTVESINADQLSTVQWDNVSLVLWQSALPSESAAELLEAFVDRGGQVVFFPPRNPDDAKLFGVQWKTWISGKEDVAVDTWRSDEDVLAHTLSGSALPVGQLEIRQYCGFEGEVTPLAKLRGGAPLLARVATPRGGVYFWATTPAPGDSSLATSGVVLYAFLQRSLAEGASVLGKARQLNAGDAAGEDPSKWERVTEGDDGISTESQFHRGIYRVEDRLLAVNRPAVEDGAKTLADTRVAELFEGLDFVRVDDQAGSLAALIHEVWRAFLGTMLVALMLEAALCYPKGGRRQEGQK